MKGLSATTVCCLAAALVATGTLTMMPASAAVPVAAGDPATTPTATAPVTTNPPPTTAPATATATAAASTTPATSTPVACDPAPPTSSLLSATTTSLTFTYASSADQCGKSGDTRIVVATELGNFGAQVGEGYGSASSGTITVTGLSPGTIYYYYTDGGGSPFGGDWGGPVNTLPEGTGTVTPPVCLPPAPDSMTMTKLPVPAGYTVYDVVAMNDRGAVVANAGGPGGLTVVTWGPDGTFTDLGTLPDARDSRAVGINNDGTVVGVASMPTAYDHAVMWKRGAKIMDLGTLGGPLSEPIGIGNDGTIFGSTLNSAGDERAVKWDSHGRITDLGTLGGKISHAYVQNDVGMAAGFSATAENPDGYPLHTVLWDRTGKIVDVGSADIPWFGPRALNNAGTLIGYYNGPVRWDRRNGVRNLPPVPDSAFYNAVAINDAGTIAGLASVGGGSVAIRWDSSGAVRELPNLPGRSYGYAKAINDAGTIIGSVAMFNQVPHAVRWDSAGNVADLGGITSCDASTAVAINASGAIAGTVRLAAATTNIPVRWH